MAILARRIKFRANLVRAILILLNEHFTLPARGTAGDKNIRAAVETIQAATRIAAIPSFGRKRLLSESYTE
jgi:hypothetical protein